MDESFGCGGIYLVSHDWSSIITWLSMDSLKLVTFFSTLRSTWLMFRGDDLFSEFSRIFN